MEYLLKNGLAVHSQSPWSSPCLLVQKPDSSFRFCTDYRKVNSVTKVDSFPYPALRIVSIELALPLTSLNEISLKGIGKSL